MSILREPTPHSPRLHVLELLGQLLDLSLRWLHVSKTMHVTEPTDNG